MKQINSFILSYFNLGVLLFAFVLFGAFFKEHETVCRKANIRSNTINYDINKQFSSSEKTFK